MFGGHQFFFWGQWYPCFSASGDVWPRFQSQAGSLTCFVVCMQLIPQIQFWCDTCWPLDGQCGSWDFLIHILAHMYASIGRTWSQDRVCADALPNKPCQVGILLFNNKKKKKQRKLQQLLEKWSLKNESKGNLSKQKLKNEPFQTRQPGKKRENRSPFQKATTGKNTY